MTDESRLYAKLTLDFADSHKIAPLSDAAFRAYIRMLLWSRRMLTDGKIPGRMALFFAKPKVLEELSTNDVESPSLRREGDDYFIHDFAEHQSTKAEIEAQRERNAANGRKGGQARAKRVASKSLSENEAEPKPSSSENVATFNTETETETETTTSNEVARTAKAELERAFAEAWSHWPKKVDRKQAFERFTKATKQIDVAELVASVIRFGDAYAVTTETQFVPALGVWIGRERWTDELPGTQRGPKHTVRDETSWMQP